MHEAGISLLGQMVPDEYHAGFNIFQLLETGTDLAVLATLPACGAGSPSLRALEEENKDGTTTIEYRTEYVVDRARKCRRKIRAAVHEQNAMITQ